MRDRLANEAAEAVIRLPAQTGKALMTGGARSLKRGDDLNGTVVPTPVLCSTDHAPRSAGRKGPSDAQA